MALVRNEIRALQSARVKTSATLEKRKKVYEKLTPGFFNILLLFAGLVTLIAFFYIIGEMRIRMKYHKELENRLQELNRSYAELEQFTFVASHDLQEPLRKIRTFSDRLLSKYSEALDPKARIIIERMDASAARLQELIHDITNFSELINQHEAGTIVDMNQVVEKALVKFQSRLQQKILR